MKNFLIAIMVSILAFSLSGCLISTNSLDTQKLRVLVEMQIKDSGDARLKYFATSVDLSILRNHWSWECSKEIHSQRYRILINYWEDIGKYVYSIGQWDKNARVFLSNTNGHFRGPVNRRSEGIISHASSDPYYAVSLTAYYGPAWYLSSAEPLSCVIVPDTQP